jgi:hypothetical protein
VERVVTGAVLRPEGQPFVATAPLTHPPAKPAATVQVGKIEAMPLVVQSGIRPGQGLKSIDHAAQHPTADAGAEAEATPEPEAPRAASGPAARPARKGTAAARLRPTNQRRVAPKKRSGAKVLHRDTVARRDR